jgi:hypothetical protein
MELGNSRVRRTGGNGCGFYFIGSQVRPVGTDGEAVDGEIHLGSNSYRYGDGYFAGTVNSNFLRSQRVIQDGSPVVDAKGLIKTLTTLRQATLDETQDIRESLRSAIDELVSGFEQEIAAMPAEVSE